MLIQQAMINEMRQGITILQGQDNVIIKEAREIGQGIHKQIDDSLKEQTKSGSTLLNHRRIVIKLKHHLKELQISNLVLSSKIEAMEKVMKTLPMKNDLSIQAKAMDEALATIQEVSTELTVHMEEYTISGSTTHAPRSVQAGPSYTHPDRRPQVEEYYEYVSSLSTQDDARQHYRLKGGN
jgi:hypothetical protein